MITVQNIDDTMFKVTVTAGTTTTHTVTVDPVYHQRDYEVSFHLRLLKAGGCPPRIAASVLNDPAGRPLVAAMPPSAPGPSRKGGSKPPSKMLDL